jgi:hypothetical protein
MSTYDFVLWIIGLVLLFLAYCIKQAVSSDRTTKFSYGEWEQLSVRAKETLINHGYKPPVAPHATFTRPAVYGGKTPRRPLERTRVHDDPHGFVPADFNHDPRQHAKYMKDMKDQEIPDDRT